MVVVVVGALVGEVVEVDVVLVVDEVVELVTTGRVVVVVAIVVVVDGAGAGLGPGSGVGRREHPATRSREVTSAATAVRRVCMPR